MISIATAIVDSGPLYASACRADPDHEACLEALQSGRYQLVIPALCVAEAAYLLGTRHGPAVEAEFLRGLRGFDVEAPIDEEWPRIAELVEQYASLPLGGTDASVVALAERFETDTIITLDFRDFSVIRPRHCDTFRLLPEHSRPS